MIELQSLIDYLNMQFKTKDHEKFNEEVQITYDSGKKIRKVGYCTNLTPDVINKAKVQNVDLIITHHDAWEFIDGLKEECLRLLDEYKISHYFNHLPLDDCEFGTNSSLASQLNLVNQIKALDYKGFKCGIIGEFDAPVEFNELVKIVESKLEEPVQSWQFNNNPIKKVFIVCGAGFSALDMKEAVHNDCDVYITGEKILYTVEYAQLKNLNLIVGSHTFIELLGVRSMAEKLKSQFNNIEIVRINEEHIEAMGFKNHI